MSVTVNPQGLDFVQYKLAEKFVVRNFVTRGMGMALCAALLLLSRVTKGSRLCSRRNKERRRWPLTTKRHSPLRLWRLGSGSSTPEWATSFSHISTGSVPTQFPSTHLSRREWLWKTTRGEVVFLLTHSPRGLNKIQRELRFALPPFTTPHMYLDFVSENPVSFVQTRCFGNLWIQLQ